MMGSFLKKFFGSANDRIIKKHIKVVQRINALEETVSKLSDEELKNRTPWLKDRLAKGETLDDILPDAFATVREGSKRALGMRPFDVQLIGGMILHDGMIAEMKTGEGKTLVATLPVYLNALSGKGVHVVTINDYLAKRDSDWMGQLYQYLGLSVGCIVHGLDDEERRQQYHADITYGTNHEFGFDYLRDNMKFHLEEIVQREFNYAIVDEVDSILVDEARTPLIISGSAEDSSDLYQKVNSIMLSVGEGDFEKDEKQRSVTLTEQGVERVEALLTEKGWLKGVSLYDIPNISLVHHVNQALKAHKLFTRDVDYIVKDDKVIIIDEFTGRMMDGRRYSDGLHQSLEAKEGVTIEMENQTLASITYQNFFRLYKKLSGMTGTAMTEAAEFEEIYKLRVASVPTNVRVQRIDHDDEVYLTAKEKQEAVVEEIKQCRKREQPVLVGTTSIEKSELYSELLKKHKIPHQVLNARYHEQEALIVAEAGRPGAITIATNMAGRGTDIKLGGNLESHIGSDPVLKELTDEKERAKRIALIKSELDAAQEKVKKAGGLYIIGTERHESRRIDNQLRGRSGRQGDPGASKFFISLEDDLMRIFGSERLDGMLRRLGVKEGEAISHSWISKALERAQQKVEARNFDIRKHLLRYDDVMNDQRKIVYEQRRDLMRAQEAQNMITDMNHEVIENILQVRIPEHALAEQWDIAGLHEEILRVFGLNLPFQEWVHESGITEKEIEQRIVQAVEALRQSKEEQYGSPILRVAEKSFLLRVLDQLWKDHLLALDHLRQGINLRAYAQSNPLNEYKREAFNLFQELMYRVKETVVNMLAHFQMHGAPEEALDQLLEEPDFSHFSEETPDWTKTLEDFAPSSVREPHTQPSFSSLEAPRGDAGDRVQRNAPCPCNSGKKFKHCHGAL